MNSNNTKYSFLADRRDSENDELMRSLASFIKAHSLKKLLLSDGSAKRFDTLMQAGEQQLISVFARKLRATFYNNYTKAQRRPYEERLFDLAVIGRCFTYVFAKSAERGYFRKSGRKITFSFAYEEMLCLPAHECVQPEIAREIDNASGAVDEIFYQLQEQILSDPTGPYYNLNSRFLADAIVSSFYVIGLVGLTWGLDLRGSPGKTLEQKMFEEAQKLGWLDRPIPQAIPAVETIHMYWWSGLTALVEATPMEKRAALIERCSWAAFWRGVERAILVAHFPREHTPWEMDTTPLIENVDVAAPEPIGGMIRKAKQNADRLYSSFRQFVQTQNSPDPGEYACEFFRNLLKLSTQYAIAHGYRAKTPEMRGIADRLLESALAGQRLSEQYYRKISQRKFAFSLLVVTALIVAIVFLVRWLFY